MRRLAAVRRLLVLVAAAIVAIAGCGAPILANAPVVRPAAPASPSPAPRPPDPVPVELPRDDAPHDRLTEWWYFTGHLAAGDERRFGFEYVIFRAERGAFPVSWASHLALTDETGDRFLYAQRTEVGPQVSLPSAEASNAAFDFGLTGSAIPGGPTPGSSAWTMRGDSASATLAAAADATEAGGNPFGLDLRLAGVAPPVLHDRDGWIDFGPAGGSYYYSRTKLAATGAITVDRTTVPVRGSAWFDHQWGDFIAVGGGGWDWFAVNLDDGTDLSFSLVRDADGSYPLVYGTLVAPDGSTRHLPADAFRVDVTGRWRSPRTGADYPAGWRITIPSESLEIELEPSVADQELDTRPSTGVVYWEGSQRVRATRDGRALGGEAYVELTGYAPSATTATGSPGAGG